VIVFGLFRGCSLAVQPILVLDASIGWCAAVRCRNAAPALRRGGPSDLRVGSRAHNLTRATNLILTGQVGEFAVPRRDRGRLSALTAALSPVIPARTADSGLGAHQYALRFRITSKNVLIRIWKSSSRLQLLMYQRSSLTRRTISSTERVAPREPLHCAHPVRPGFT
jgi:hypothetical protein